MQDDRRRSRRALDAYAGATVVERQVPVVPFCHEEQHIVAGRRERRAGRPCHLPGAKTLPTIDGLVDGASRNQDFGISELACAVLVEETLVNANAIRREHESARGVLDTEGDLRTVGQPHRTSASALHRTDDDAIAHPHCLLEAERGG